MTTKEGSSSRGLLFPDYIRSANILPEITREEKEELIEELCRCPENAHQKLLSLKRKDIIELISIENRREIRSTNKLKPELIDLLCSIISDKISGREKQAIDFSDPAVLSDTLALPPLNARTSIRNKRKSSHPSRLLLVKFCQNSACKAQMKSSDAFCKRCSCYICHEYDDNKNPSCWLVCEAETYLQDKPCGLSCHLECALKNERAGNMDNKSGRKLDGSYQCGNCGSVSDLMSCWRKLLMEAKDARRVSDLCHRIYLSHKIVDSIKRKLEDEVGSLNNLPLDMSRRLVCRLSVGAEAQKLCSRAIDFLDSETLTTSQFNPIESQISEGGVTNQSNLKGGIDVPNQSNLKGGIDVPNQSNLKGGINVPVPELKVEKTESKEKLMIDLNELPDNHTEDCRSMDGELRATTGHDLAIVPISTSDKKCSEGSEGKNGIKIGCKHEELGALHTMKYGDDYTDKKYQQIINVIRRLECDGHINSHFRKEFLTWFSMRATPKNEMQVCVFIDTFSDDPQSLAEQLFHTFGQEISSKRPPNAIAN